jgi:phosphohistidine phosphatase
MRDGMALDGGSDRAYSGGRSGATIGEYLHDLIGRPDAIVTSDARRARQTAELVAEATDFGDPVTLDAELYGADPDTLLRIVRALPDEATTVVLVGHNPGLEALAAALAQTDEAVELPTAGLAHLEFDTTRWSEVAPRTGRWRGVTTPKSLA